MDICL